MIRKYITRSMLLMVAADQFVLVGSIALALWGKKHLLLADLLLPVQAHVDLFVRLWPFLAITLVLAGAYDLHLAVGGLRPLMRRTLVSILALAGVSIGGAFFFKINDLFSYSRGVFGLFFLFTAFGLIAVRLAFAEIASLWRTRTGRCRRVLVFGGESFGETLIPHLQKQIFAAIQVTGVTGELTIPGVPRLTEEEAIRRIRQGELDSVVVDVPPRRIRLLLQVAQAAEREGVPMQITPAVFPGIHLQPRIDHIDDLPIIELCGGDLPLSGLLAKRVFDFISAAAGLLVLSPLFLIVAVAIKLTSRGPVFYSQERVGLNGRRFRILKFRTMFENAEAATGPIWATEDDPRATPVGRLLRRTKIDELPQLLNVLIGSMSLVGPRPERPEFVEQFKPVIERYSHKHWVKPGITGWAQVNGWCGQTDLNRRIEHDIYYIERWSLWFDVKILFMTLMQRYRHAV